MKYLYSQKEHHHEEMELYHYGIEGMHWGQRRFQYKDGSLTELGYERYYGHSRSKKKHSGLSSKEFAKHDAKQKLPKFKDLIAKYNVPELSVNQFEKVYAQKNNETGNKFSKIAQKHNAYIQKYHDNSYDDTTRFNNEEDLAEIASHFTNKNAKEKIESLYNEQINAKKELRLSERDSRKFHQLRDIFDAGPYSESASNIRKLMLAECEIMANFFKQYSLLESSLSKDDQIVLAEYTYGLFSLHWQ